VARRAAIRERRVHVVRDELLTLPDGLWSKVGRIYKLLHPDDQLRDRVKTVVAGVIERSDRRLLIASANAVTSHSNGISRRKMEPGELRKWLSPAELKEELGGGFKKRADGRRSNKYAAPRRIWKFFFMGRDRRMDITPRIRTNSWVRPKELGAYDSWRPTHSSSRSLPRPHQPAKILESATAGRKLSAGPK